MSTKQAISIVVPTLNEAENIPSLLARIDTSLQNASIDYEVIIVDDYSSDGTMQVADQLSALYPVRCMLKQGKRGKAFSLLEGFDAARYPLIAMIDADLQYAPEELVPMFDLLVEKNADVVITDRTDNKTSLLRKAGSKVLHYTFAKLLFGLDFDTQSGLKLFRREVIEGVSLDPSPWTFDMEFLVRALENKRTIISHTIAFSERTAGVSKTKAISSTLEFAKSSIKLRWRTSARKTRAGYRENSRFLERAFPAAVLTLLCAFSLLGLHAQTTSALSLPVDMQAASPIVSSVLDPLTNLLDSGNGAAAQTQPTPGTTQSPSQPTTPAANTTAGRSGASTSGTTTAAAVNQSKGIGTVSVANASSQTPTITLASADTTKLAPATGTDSKHDIYASGYPYYKLSSNSTNNLSSAAKVAWIAGALCGGTVILLAGSKLASAYGARKIIQRS